MIEIVMKKVVRQRDKLLRQLLLGQRVGRKAWRPDDGFVAEGNFKTLDECASFLDIQARKHWPESLYALGYFEHARREANRENK